MKLELTINNQICTVENDDDEASWTTLLAYFVGILQAQGYVLSEETVGELLDGY